MKTKQILKFITKPEIKISRHFSVSIWFFAVALFSVLGRYSGLFFTAFTVAFLHELAHVFCARCMNVPISRITILPFGVAARLTSSHMQNSEKEFFIAFSGPLTNLILFWISTFVLKYINTSYIVFFADVNLSMAALNLLPILPLDGGRMLKAVLTLHFGFMKAYNAVLKLSRTLIVLLIISGVSLFFVTGFNFSLILVSAFLLQNLTYEKNTLSHIAFREITENTSKLERKKIFFTKTFCVSEELPISSILKLLSYDYFCVFYVIDKNHKVSKIITETHVLNSMAQHSVKTKFSQI